MSKETFALDLEEKLADDGDGWFKEELLERLRNEAVGIKCRMDAGVPPAEFARLQKTAAALDAAATVVEGVWARMHPGG